MCSAPANSRNDSMPCISTSEKSMARRNDSSYCRSAWLTPQASSSTMTSDSARAITITPMAIGRRVKRWFRYVSSAVTTRQRAAMSSMEVVVCGGQ